MRRRRGEPSLTEKALLQKINPGHRGQKRALQIIGPTLLVVGAIFVVVGLISFANSFGETDAGLPMGFWLFGLGAVLASIGLPLTKIAFLGEIGRYGAGELAPVARDTLEYVNAGSEPTLDCRSCGQANEAGSNFCESCGAPLAERAPS